jgi:hypothetical protein
MPKRLIELEGDVEGHARRFSESGDETVTIKLGSGEEVRGHMRRGPEDSLQIEVDDDVEGHRKWGPAVTQAEDVEGHRKWEPSMSDADDAEGHMRRMEPSMSDADDVEGHRKWEPSMNTAEDVEGHRKWEPSMSDADDAEGHIVTLVFDSGEAIRGRYYETPSKERDRRFKIDLGRKK